ncbi:hypothetical protein [Streptomyces sp. YS-3]|uniref:hypothetical protein n=1 Tax=Streptomyces sp. YS-3 TaxID=3381352 RepID=UPI00386A1792
MACTSRPLNQDEYLASTENRTLTGYVMEGTEFKEVKDAMERAQLKAIFKWNLDYWDYAYSTLPGLVSCFPSDGHLILRGSKQDDARCDDWVSWSQSIHDAFLDPRLCQTLNDNESVYGKGFVAAIRKSEACVK